MSLTDQQRRVLDAIQGRLRRQGYPPTTRELAQHLGVAIGTVQAHPRALERKGALKRRPFQARGLYLTAPEDGLGARPSGTSPFWGLQEALRSPLLLLQPLAVLPKAALLGVLRTSLRSGHGGHGLLLSFEVGCGWRRPWPKVHVISRTFMKGFR